MTETTGNYSALNSTVHMTLFPRTRAISNDVFFQAVGNPLGDTGAARRIGAEHFLGADHFRRADDVVATITGCFVALKARNVKACFLSGGLKIHSR